MGLHEDLISIQQTFQAELAGAATADDLEALRVKHLGRKSAFSNAMRALKDVPEAERKQLGAAVNEVKQEMTQAFEKKKAELERARYDLLGSSERIDISMPGIVPPQGHLHMTTQAMRDISAIFERLGFTRTRPPEVEWEWYSFEKLRIGADHPARDNWETFFIDAPADAKYGKMILTPHTTNGTYRELERGDLPIRVMNINKTYRRQSDVSHIPMFHQFDGLLVDRGVTITDLKGLFEHFAKEFFGPEREIRLRPHHFRFTEPSFEVDITCGLCHGQGCRMCKEGWVELGGSGMLHPEILEDAGIDSNEYTAFAFGWGVERTASMRAGINVGDLRVMYRNDIRFLEQF